MLSAGAADDKRTSNRSVFADRPVHDDGPIRACGLPSALSISEVWESNGRCIRAKRTLCANMKESDLCSAAAPSRNSLIFRWRAMRQRSRRFMSSCDGSACLTLDPNLPCLLMCRAVSLILEHGNCDASRYAYAELATCWAIFRRLPGRLSVGEARLRTRRTTGIPTFRGQDVSVCGFVMAWSSHVRAARLLLRRAFETANRAGDLTHAAFDCYHLNTNLLAAGDPLSEAQREAENGLAFVRKIRFHFAVDWSRPSSH